MTKTRLLLALAVAWPCVASAASPVTVITTGGTAVQAIVGPATSVFIGNYTTAAQEGIATAENLYLNLSQAPGSTDAAVNGTTWVLAPGQTYTIPILGPGVILYLNAATSAHRYYVQASP